MGSEDPAQLFQRIWSPYCKGVSLLECPSSQAEDLRMEIRKQFNEGKTSEQVWQDLQLKYGSQLRMEPETGGREALAYWLPWGSFLFITALLILIWFTRKSRKPPPTVPAVPSREKEIIEDLRRREGL